MKILIDTNNLSFTIKSKRRFVLMVRKYLIINYRMLIINNRDVINKKLSPIHVSHKELLDNLDNFIIVHGCESGILVGFNPLTTINKISMSGIVKSIDYGSRITGSPFPLFSPILTNLQRMMIPLYQKFIGFS